MVGIRRTAPNRLRGVGGNKSPGSSSIRVMMGYARTFLVGLVALYGLGMLISLARTPSISSSSSSSSTISSGEAGGGSPMGVHQVLKNSHLRIPPKQPPEIEVTPAAKDLADLAAAKPSIAEGSPQKPPPTIPIPIEQAYGHHLEEPDIHMQHPDPPKQQPPVSNEAQVVNNSNTNRIDGKGSAINQIVLHKKGTGSTTVAYVRDFQSERDNPAFRHDALQTNDSSSVVATMVNELRVTRCLKLDNGPERHQRYQRWTMQAPCLDPDTPQIAYNAASFGRTWCGQEIGPKSAVVMSEHCTDSTVHLFPHETPPASGRGMPPMTIKKSNPLNVEDKSALETVECDIPCLQEPGLVLAESGVARRYFEGEAWAMVYTLANSFTEGGAGLERTDYRREKYYSTQSFKASVPLSYYDADKFSLRNRPPVAYESAKPKAVYMVNDACASAGSKRQKYVAAIANVFPVESLGDCQHNTDIPNGMTIDTSEGRIELMKQYRFVLAFDRTKEKDHISTMVWEALVSGSVPVIVGADNLRFHLPAHSYIDFGAYSDWDALAEAVKEINENKEQWESYHAWRTDEVALAKFEAMYEFTKTRPECRLCRWGYAKKYGLGWDHVKQQVTETHLARNLCTTSSKGLASKPFAEEWISRNEEDELVVSQGDEGGTESCTSTAESTIDNGSTYKIQRSVVEHDGVIDMVISDIERETTKQELVLRLHFPGVQNSDGAHFANTHTTVHGLTHGPLVSSASMQDDVTKVTVLADWVTSISCPKDGVLEIVVVEQHENEEQPSKPLSPNIPKRLRIIIEDMNVIHDKLTEYFPSSYASTMVKDFVDPIEIYFADS